MARISYVEAKAAHRLLVELDTGMVLYVNMSDKINTCRFLDLKNDEVFKNVQTDGNMVYWSDGFVNMTLNEIYQLNNVNKPVYNSEDEAKVI